MTAAPLSPGSIEDNETRPAAPVAADVEAIAALDPATRAALHHLLVALADNKYVLGRRYAEWCTGAPVLEAAVAAAAMAQDELGHARSFYPLLRAFPEVTAADTREEQGWQERPTSAMRCIAQPFLAWSDFVAANVVVDTALTILLEAAADAAYEPLRQRARKIVQEEESHWVHGVGWVRRLTVDETQRQGLQQRLTAMGEEALAWLGRDDDPALRRLVEAAMLAAGPAVLRSHLRERLDAAGVRL